METANAMANHHTSSGKSQQIIKVTDLLAIDINRHFAVPIWGMWPSVKTLF
jgi:hypothetical protein